MILYFADRAFNILGLAGDKIKRGYNIENDEEEIDVESGVATFSFDIYYTEDKRSEVEKITYAGNYILHKDKNDFKAYTIIDTEQSTENMSINVRAEDMGLDLINDVCMPFNYETADFNDQTDYAYEGNAGHIGYINESGEYVADQNYRATNYIDLPSTLPEACLFRVSKTETGSKRYSTAFYDTNKNFISGSGKYYYLSDSEQVSRVDIPLTAKYARISFHKDITSAFFIPSSVKSYDISTYIGLCIANSGFEVGINEIGETRIPLEFEDTQTASERINEIVGYFEAEFGFSFEFDGMIITKKAINLYKHRGTDNRVELRLGREVKNIRINRSVAELATAIIPIGTAVDENGEDVYFSLQGYDGEIESGYYIEDNMLCSTKAFSKWSRYLSASGRRSGHIVKKFEYECSTQKTLYEYALSDLKAIEDAATTYEVELYSLPDSVSLGDTVYVVDDAGEIYISARVFRIRKSEINDTIVTELGDFVTRSSGIVDEWSIFRQKFAAWSEANSVKYVWVAYADDNQGTGISISPTGKNWMGLADNQKTQNVDLSDPSIFNWIQLTAKDGRDGNDGVGVRSTTVSYAVSTSPNIMPGNNDWGSTIPTVPKGQVLWVRTVTDYTDDNIPDTVTYSYSIQGNDGQQGGQGAPGTSITVSSIEYVSWPTNQQPPDSASWQTTIPTVLPGDYLWTRTTFSDNNVIYGLARQGEDGQDGESITITDISAEDGQTTVTFSDGSTMVINDGERGIAGPTGPAGVSNYIHIAWANSSDGVTDFSTSVSANKRYFGTYTDDDPLDSQTPSDYNWSLIKGADGTRGAIWYSGTGITGTSTTATIFSGSGVSSAIVGDMYLNTSTYNTYKCTVAGNASTAKWVYVNNIKGSAGGNGDDGRGISSIDREYYLSTSNTSQTGGSWKTNPDAYVSGRYYWYRDKIVWTNPTETTYTTAVLDNGLNSANSNASNAVSTANTASTNASNAVTTANAASTAAQNAANAAAAAQATAEAASVEYIVGTQTAATGTWTGVTRDSSLQTGKTIAYKLPYAGSGNASLNLTLSGGGTTGAKAVYLNTTRVTTHFGAGSVIQMTYDGSYWRVTSIPDTNNYDRVLHNNYIVTADTIRSNKLICGTSNGYKEVAASVVFDLNYPILYYTGSDKAAGNSITAYETYPSSDPSVTGTVEGAAVDKTLWLKVKHVAGSRFVTAEENFLTCVIPNTKDEYYYIPLGTYAHDSTTKLYFVSNDRLYAVPDQSEQYEDKKYNGQPVTVDNSTGLTKISDLSINLNPIQNLNGYDYPTYENICPITGHNYASVGIAGKNLLSTSDTFSNWRMATPTAGNEPVLVQDSPTNYVHFPDVATSTIQQAAICERRIPYFMLRNKTLTFSLDVRVASGATTDLIIQYEVYANATGGSRTIYTNRDFDIVTGTGNWVHLTQTRTFTDDIFVNGSGNPNFETCYVRVSVWKQHTIGSTAGFDIRNPQLEFGSTGTTFVASPSLTEIMTPLGQTVYGGSVDLTTGVLTLTYGLVTFDGSADESWGLQGGGRRCGIGAWLPNCKVVEGTNRTIGALSNLYEEKNPSATWASEIGFSIEVNGTLVVRQFTTDTMTTDSFKAFLQNNPMQVCYPLQTPTTVQLTTQQIDLLLGINNIHVDSYNSLDVTVREHSIQNREFQPLDTAAILNSRSFKSVLTTYKDEQNGVFLGLRTDISSVRSDTDKNTSDIVEQSQKITAISNELKNVYQVDKDTGEEYGVLANVFTRVNTLENNIQTAMSYMSEEGLNVETSRNPDTVTTITGDGIKTVSSSDRSKILMYVNNVQTMIRDVSIIGYLDVAGTSLSQKNETEYDGTTSKGLAFYN